VLLGKCMEHGWHGASLHFFCCANSALLQAAASLCLTPPTLSISCPSSPDSQSHTTLLSLLLCCAAAGRSLTLLDPTYASRFVPIIASVSEHQPPSWPSYITDLHFAALLAPAGIMAAFRKLDNGECPGRKVQD
jgi:hypothetical protein